MTDMGVLPSQDLLKRYAAYTEESTVFSTLGLSGEGPEGENARDDEVERRLSRI
jgi:hypothetical protein